MDKKDELKVKKMISDAIDKALKDERVRVNKEFIQSFKKHEKEIKEFIKKENEKLGKEKLGKKEIKELIIKSFMRQYRFMWEKGKFVTTYLNDL